MLSVEVTEVSVHTVLDCSSVMQWMVVVMLMLLVNVDLYNVAHCHKVSKALCILVSGESQVFMHCLYETYPAVHRGHRTKSSTSSEPAQ